MKIEENGWLESQEIKSSTPLLYTFYVQPNINVISHVIKSKANSVQT